MNEIWSEKYRPKTIDRYVFKNNAQKEQIKDMIASGTISHLLFKGPAGTGKTTAAKMILHELKVDDNDVLEINASINNGIEYIRDTIVGFASTMPFGDMKYVVLDESDYISQNGQAALRGVMQDYANTCRFILTCNYANKIIPAIHSRCQVFSIDALDKVEFTARIAEILISENVEFDIDSLDAFVKAAYPDMRKCINLCQQNSSSGTLKMPDESSSSDTSDYKLEMIALFKQGKYKEARSLICKQISQEEYEDMYRFMYENLDLWGDTAAKQDECVLVIKNGLVDHSMVGDPEICLSATLIRLEHISQQ